MAADYAAFDWEVTDYNVYCLDRHVLDAETNSPLLLRGPRPETLGSGNYLACIGAAQTFGRFCEQPFPILLGNRLGLPILNLGRGGAGPAFFSHNQKLLEYINRARFAVIQVMSGRSASNSLYESRGLGHYRRRSDGSTIGCDAAFRGLLANYPIEGIKKIVAETRGNWVDEYVKLLNAIRVPRILFWFSTRYPAYRERYANIDDLYGEFPQMVCPWMIKAISQYTDAYVECISRKGLPHQLVSRQTGQPITIGDPWGGQWRQNSYYPSPEMHDAAAKALEEGCRRFIGSGLPSTSKVSKNVKSVKRFAPTNAFHSAISQHVVGLLGGHKHYRRFIILGRGRSGSNFLRGLLNSHNHIIVFGELFNFCDSIGWEFPDYDRFLQNRRLISLMRHNPAQFLDQHVFKRFPKSILAVGFKLFYYHAQDDSRKTLWPFIKNQTDLRIIHIKRNNALKVLLSEKRAFQTNR
jgi:hypothetical protein